MSTASFRFCLFALAIEVLSGCGGGGGTATTAPTPQQTGSTGPSSNVSPPPSPPAYTLGGTISGLSELGLMLQNGSDSVSPTAGSVAFSFPTQVVQGASYDVVIASQPTGLTCTVANASGTMASSNPAIAVSCADTVWVVSTLAGSTSATEIDGSGIGASFDLPCGVTVASSGTVYAADYGGNTIRMITATGNVTTIAGSTTAAETDGAGLAARFNGPCGVAVAKSGNVYVADYLGPTIRKITPAGQVTTFAGTAGQVGFVDDTGGAAQFDHPIGLAVDAAENVYVSDSGNCAIRKIAPSGAVTTIAGGGPTACYWLDGQGAAARFNVPFGVAVDAAGNVFVADLGNNAIREINPAGLVTTLAGSTIAGMADGVGMEATFAGPTGVAVDANDTVYVTQVQTASTGALLRRIAMDGTVTTIAGSPTLFTGGYLDGLGMVAQFSSPYLIAVDGSDDLYVADFGNSVVRKLMPQGD